MYNRVLDRQTRLLFLSLKALEKAFSQTDILTLDCSLRQTFLLKAFWMKIHDASWSHFSLVKVALYDIIFMVFLTG